MEKKTLFIKVSCIERLPLVSGYYHTDKGIVHYSDIFEDWNQDYVEYWLEEIEIPSEEEIQSVSPKTRCVNQFWNGANFILNHLKSNTNG